MGNGCGGGNGYRVQVRVYRPGNQETKERVRNPTLLVLLVLVLHCTVLYFIVLQDPAAKMVLSYQMC